ncbi:MAG TPA: imidazole glycerol phosphate synthase subunit HisH [Kiritimatiellae bacterium]|nr:imidazole glycerol phosphate synthase subunit HisH [Kiritimatiellia bacterium]
MIAIIDYGMGNLGSVMNACRYLGLEASLVKTPAALGKAKAVVLPGVGAFGDCMKHLVGQGLAEAIREWILAGRPYLGICLGLQILCNGSEESAGVNGLSIITMRVRRFESLPAEMKVPHMGWNQIHINESACGILKGIGDGEFFYFVHSYYVPETEDGTAAWTEYGTRFCSVYHCGNLFAVQFHPERSHRAGLRVLRNFAAIAEKT